MNYFFSFGTTLKISRYLFRALVLMIWLLGLFLTVFYIVRLLNEKENQVRQQYNSSYEQAQWFIRHSTDIVRELRHVAENRPNGVLNGADVSFVSRAIMPQFYPLSADADCTPVSWRWRNQLASLSAFLNYRAADFASAYGVNHLFFMGGHSHCLADFNIGHVQFDRERTIKSLHEHLFQADNAVNVEQENAKYWISTANQPDRGYFYYVTPVTVAGERAALLGIEQTIRLDDLLIKENLPVSVMLIDENNMLVLAPMRGRVDYVLPGIPAGQNWFGYSEGFRQLVMKRSLPASGLSLVYSVPSAIVLGSLKSAIVGGLWLNLACAVLLFFLARLFERRVFFPAENNVQQLEEQEQFNRKIVASAPVGICILRTSDGTNILSNELAHNYLTLLTPEDRQRLTEMICQQQVNFVDVLTGSHTNLQISFVHSRYRNENVAICVLVDVSARVKMEESLQEMAQAAERASQSKSMFLATVSHELRTPLYGIIGNLDLMQSCSLPKGVRSLVTSMTNSSGMLLKIISDILDFSKMESEQLRIEPRAFSPREMISHITANYLSLVVRKRLTLYCFIEQDVPLLLENDPLRLQQVISNLLNNAIKFTHTGCIILHVYVKDCYLAFRLRDTGVGISDAELLQLFDPFYQVGNGVQRHFQGTGLGLAICEKLLNMMDGDIEVDSEPGMGSQFIVRIPLYGCQKMPASSSCSDHEHVRLAIRNDYLFSFLYTLLNRQGIQVSRLENEESYDSDDIIVADYAYEPKKPLLAVVEFNGSHIDMPQESRPGRWVCSTAMPHELPALLHRIRHVPTDEVTKSIPDSTPPADEKEQNEDSVILVVDDHPLNRMLLSDQLHVLGFQVKTAQDGVDALQVLGQSEIDIVLTDVNMPNMDGYGLTQRLRQLGHRFPIIGVTANALAEEKQRCMEAGMDDCLSKPVTLDALRELLRHYREKAPERHLPSPPARS